MDEKNEKMLRYTADPIFRFKTYYGVFSAGAILKSKL
jgi:hypothetical protein